MIGGILGLAGGSMQEEDITNNELLKEMKANFEKVYKKLDKITGMLGKVQQDLDKIMQTVNWIYGDVKEIYKDIVLHANDLSKVNTYWRVSLKNWTWRKNTRRVSYFTTST
eukprot:TRINITY_DN12729_c0_g1_i2.p2 TRINITY_DN12729_c0_g1~~TRINITY_DN12729_c0_g1_i2.p2  ORF type:complete len:111 (-),score=24.37 TRINITY_DN12729_c0_g1_i2:747-1079(-)